MPSAISTAVAIGGVIALPLPDGATGARHDGEDVLVVANHAIVGVGLDAELGERAVTALTAGGEQRLAFTVVAKQYPERHLTTSASYVSPSTEALARIRRETATQRAAYALRTPTRAGLVPFARPAEGPRSSPFGARSFYNGQPRAPHSGLDIGAPSGTPVYAPAPGAVAVVGDFFFNGKTVIVDHGGGLVTMYCHLRDIEIAEGDELGRGDRLGTIGATGRATGPHLHWTVKVGGVAVDPEQFMAVFNALGAQ